MLGIMLLGALSAFGNGYQVTLKSARQTAMGNTGTALAFDASAIFFNPGALGFHKQNSINVGVSFVTPNIKYVGPGTATYTAESANTVSTPFYAFGSYGINEKLTVGLGIFTPFGSTVEWEADWAGSTALEKLSLAVFYVQPTVSYKINDKLSVGGGIDLVFGSVNLQRAAPFAIQGTGQFIPSELDGSADLAFGYNLGVYYQPSDMVSIGVNYRSRVNVQVNDGDATFEAPPSLSGILPNTTFDAELPMPEVFAVGVSVYPTEKLTITGQFDYIGWSAYQELRFDFAEPVAGSTESVSERNYDDAIALRIGAEYQVLEPLAIRAGFYYDGSPVQDGYMTPETPDSDSFVPTVGAGYQFGEKFSIDAYFMLITRPDRYNEAIPEAQNISGTYQVRNPVYGFGLNYAF